MPNHLNVPITPPRVEFIDPRSGTVSREWYMFFLSLFQLVGGSNMSLEDLQKVPPVPSIDAINAAVVTATEDLSPPQDGVLSQIDELRKQVQALGDRPSDMPVIQSADGDMQPRVELGTMSQLQQSNMPWTTFDTTPQSVPTATPGTMYWDEADGNQTLSLVMAGGLVTQQIGEEQYYRIKADSTIAEGQVIMFTGSVGASGALKGAPATGLTSSTALYVMGVATENIATNGWGYVTSFGLVRGINTTGGAEAWIDGQLLYLNPAVAGGLTKTIPVAPNPKVVVAAVVHAATNGSLFIRSTFGGDLGDFEGNVNISGLADNDMLVYKSANQRWENRTPSEARDDLGLGTGTPSNGQLLIGNGTDFTTASLTAGANVTITPGAGSVTIASSTTGATGSVTLAKITLAGADGSLTFVNGLITGYSAPT